MSQEYYKESRNKSQYYTDRYRNCKILEDQETMQIFLASREEVEIPQNFNDVYHRVTSNEEGRLDLIAYQYYKNSLYWWVIAQANNIYDPIKGVSAGTLLRIPTIETLYGNNGILL